MYLHARPPVGALQELAGVMAHCRLDAVRGRRHKDAARPYRDTANPRASELASLHLGSDPIASLKAEVHFVA